MLFTGLSMWTESQQHVLDSTWLMGDQYKTRIGICRKIIMTAIGQLRKYGVRMKKTPRYILDG